MRVYNIFLCLETGMIIILKELLDRHNEVEMKELGNAPVDDFFSSFSSQVYLHIKKVC